MLERRSSDADRDLVIFRCDGGVAGGLGHVSRCLGLAEALAERHVDALFIGDYSAHALALLGAAQVECVVAAGSLGSADDRAALLSVAQLRQALGFVVDSYTIGADYLAALGVAAPVVAIDDFAALPAYPCVAVLNFTVRSARLRYPAGPAARLLGPAYMLVGPGVRRLGRRAHPPANAERVLVAIGGVDRHGLTARVLETLARVDASLAVYVVARPDERDLDTLERRVATFASGRVLTGLDSLSSPYAWADTCVSGGGLMKYESGFIGLPTGVLSQTPGEAEDVQQCVALGFVVDLGGPDVPERPLVARLTALLGDADLRRALYDASGRELGADPAARAADDVLALLRADKLVRRRERRA